MLAPGAVFDGGGHTIYNLAINSTSNEGAGFSFFEYNAGTIKDLNLVYADNYVYTGYDPMWGGIVDYNSGVVTNCSVTANVTIGDRTIDNMEDSFTQASASSPASPTRAAPSPTAPPRAPSTAPPATPPVWSSATGWASPAVWTRSGSMATSPATPPPAASSPPGCPPPDSRRRPGRPAGPPRCAPGSSPGRSGPPGWARVLGEAWTPHPVPAVQLDGEGGFTRRSTTE